MSQFDPTVPPGAVSSDAGSHLSDRASGSADDPAARSGSRFRHFRWIICALLLFGTTKNYMDRQVIGILKVTLQQQFGWTEIGYAHIVLFFQFAYALGMVVAGWIIDRLGTRLGYAVAMVVWSLASVAHAACGSVPSFEAARAALGFGEAGVFPASMKAVAEWFPRRELSLATGIFNAGTNVGVILASWLVPVITTRWGWRWSFILIGALAAVWLVLWLLIYRTPERHPAVTPAELRHIRSDPPERAGQVSWLRLLPHRQTWAFAAGKFLIDPIWWFYLFWVPSFLQQRHGLQLIQLGAPLITIYVISDLGSVAGGWISSALIRRGSSANRARKIAMLACALSVVPIVFAYRVSGTWSATLLIGLAAAGHQGFSANLFSIPCDTFPRRAVASVVGIGGMAGAIGGMGIAEMVGVILQRTRGNYMIPFLIAGSAYLVALLTIHLLSPRLEPANLQMAPDA